MDSNREKRVAVSLLYKDILEQRMEYYTSEPELEALAQQCISAIEILNQALKERYGPVEEDCYDD